MRVACIAIGVIWAAAAGAEVAYRLPWPEGRSFMFSQVRGGQITTHFTKATLHAVDIAMPEGVPVLASRGGVVEAVQAHHGAHADAEPLTYEGNFVRVRHADGTAATYAHLRYGGIVVSVGDRIEAGQTLGESGASGDVVEPHLHFVVTRLQENSAGWREEVSVPVKFYVGSPPVIFSARAAVLVKAHYSGPAELPRAASEGGSVYRTRPVLTAGEEPFAWALLAACIAGAVVGMLWFWRFSTR